ncbi:MAG: hypothetical protein ACOYON_09685 [Fimbriimonas sp.]
MALCLRIDLDYVPWDTPDAQEFGHGEPAMVLKLMEFARHTGVKFHFFASNRVLRAFPATVDAVLNEGHDLDWLSKHPTEDERYEEAIKHFDGRGHALVGLAVRGEWPEGAASPDQGLKFLSAFGKRAPEGLRLFPIETKGDREAARSGATAKIWTDVVKKQVRDTAMRRSMLTVCLRPQVLAKFDPKLTHLREIVEIATVAQLPLRTLRDLISESP